MLFPHHVSPQTPAGAVWREVWGMAGSEGVWREARGCGGKRSGEGNLAQVPDSSHLRSGWLRRRT